MVEKESTINNNGQPQTLDKGIGNLKHIPIKTLKIAKLKPGIFRLPTKEKPPELVQQPIQLPEQLESLERNPFQDLPYPSPGDRIKADDFKTLSRSLKVIYDIHQLSSVCFGRNFGEVKLALVSQQYEIHRVMSVFGNEIGNLDDVLLDNRKVIQVLPVELGERRVIIILTESVETRRTVPNLLGKTYMDATEILASALGDITIPSASITSPDLVGNYLSAVTQNR